MYDDLDYLIRIQAEIIEARRVAAETDDRRFEKALLCVADEIERRAREVDRDESRPGGLVSMPDVEPKLEL